MGIAVPLGGVQIASIPQPIPWTAIQSWCDWAGCSDDDREWFVVPLIRALDQEFLAHQAAERKKANGSRPEDKLSRWDAS